MPRSLRVLLVAGTLAGLVGCTAGDDVSTTSSLPSTTAPIGERSSNPAAVDAAETASTIVQPQATTTTTTTTTIAPVEVITEGQRIDPLFDPILDELRASSGVPVRLPASLGLDGESDLAATLVQSDDSGYLIYIGVGPDCNGGNVCRVATFTGSIMDEASPDEPAALGVSVPLPHDLRGTFFDATCGANCGDGFIEWDEADVRYSVGQKLGAGPDMLAMAWQATDPAADPPQQPDICGPDLERDDGRVAAIHTDDELDVHWLTVCSDDGISVDLAIEDGSLTWFDYDNDGSNDLAITGDDGSVALFSLAGIDAQALIDLDTFSRLRVADLRCMDLDGDGTRQFIDATDGSVYEFLNPVSVSAATTVDGADTFDRCF